jgi:hypothetical protein
MPIKRSQRKDGLLLRARVGAKAVPPLVVQAVLLPAARPVANPGVPHPVLLLAVRRGRGVRRVRNPASISRKAGASEGKNVASRIAK